MPVTKKKEMQLKLTHSFKFHSLISDFVNLKKMKKYTSGPPIESFRDPCSEVEGGCCRGWHDLQAPAVARCSIVEKPTHFSPPPKPSLVLVFLLKGIVSWG